MFEHLQPQQADAILSLMTAYKADSNPNKVDLGVGVYKTAQGLTPVLDCVKVAEAQLLAEENTKAYIGTVGSAGFNQSILKLIFGEGHPVMLENRVAAVQAPGGCGALRAGAELLNSCKAGATIWMSSPTWANHVPLFGNAGLEIKEYPYYDRSNKSIDFDAMMATLGGIDAGDVVLIHGCCHNPCGADLSLDQWHLLTDLLIERGALPYVDLAYQGFGDGLEEDVAGLRHMARHVPEMLVASSYSKNFGLYRERIGAIITIAQTPQARSNSVDRLSVIGRGIWSMPPAHGASIVETILNSDELTSQWHAELALMRNRINGLRVDVVSAIQGAGIDQDFSFIPKEKGMFSFLGITPEQVARLQKEFSIYIVGSSRINVAGFNENNMDYFVNALKTVLTGSK